MPKYLVEREITGAVIRSLGRNVQWVETFVTEDKIYCICLAPDVKLIRKHGDQGGFPA
ncbi:MAG: nickel-binding protein, partial [Methylocystis sp.]